MSKKTLTGAQILWECLVREGVNVVFGYPGGAILPAYDAMLDYPIRHVLVRHEQGATHMADGYARATGKVGVAIATSGPGATNMVTGIATAMMDSSPIVCITGQVGSALIGSDAFQETDITGITLPITKHNYLVTRADEVAPADSRGVRDRRRAAVPARCSSTSPRTRSSAPASSTGTRAAPDLASLARPGHSSGVDPLALINAAERPLILAGHGIMLGGAEAALLAFAEKAQHSDGDDAARHRRLPGVASAEPRHDGHARRGVGEHRDPGGRSADRARHALRRSRHRQSQDLRAEREEDSRRHRSGRVQQERARSTRRSPATSARSFATGCRASPSAIARSWLDAHHRAQGRLGGPRHPEPARRWASVCGACHQRPLAHHRGQARSSSPTSASTRCGRRSTTSTRRRDR